VIALAYTWGSVTAVVAAVALDLLVVKTRLLTTRLFWASYAIVLFFQLLMNGVLTGLGIVQYAPEVHLGPRLVFAPIEDVGFGFGLVTITLVLWVRLGQRAASRSALSAEAQRQRR